MKILVPVDESELNKKILDEAMDFGMKFDSELVVMTVLDEVNLSDRYFYSNIYNGKVKELEKLLEDLKEYCSDYPHNVKTIFKVGIPYLEIIKASEEENVDLIIMGNRGLGAFSRTFLGSVSNKVLNHSKKSVLVVKSKLDDEED